jgi:dinuclear metal center YbgI/SA1388 family protein
MHPQVSDIIAAMETLAPSQLAEPWDNVGLQVGNRSWPAPKIWVALDPLPHVISAACDQQVQVLVTHHPFLFRPLTCIDFATPGGDIIARAAKAKLSIIAAHTNLDIVSGGINDLIAHRLNLDQITVLRPEADASRFKFVVFAPLGTEEKIRQAIFDGGGGTIAPYECCSFAVAGQGTFKPSAAARPTTGETGRLNQAVEMRIEAVVPKANLLKVVQQVRQVHPYETMAYDLYPLHEAVDRQGLGRVGRLNMPMPFNQFAQHVKSLFEIPSLRVSGPPDLEVRQVAICSGSGGTLLKAFVTSGAQVYLSGDLGYHDAREVEQLGLALIDLGHFASEQVIIPVLAERLQQLLSQRGFEVQVKPCALEQEPFYIV